MHNKTDARSLTRRDFLRATAIGVGGMSLGLPSIKHAHAATGTKIVLVRDEEVLGSARAVDQTRLEDMLRQAVAAMTGENDPERAWKTLFKPSDVVGIKVNDMMTQTHPELVKAIVKNLRTMGIPDNKIYIWDRNKVGVGMDGTAKRDKEWEYDRQKSGLSKLITEECTALINVPGTKVHWLSGVGVAIKNWVGALDKAVLPGSQNPDAPFFTLHEDSCARLGEIAALPDIKNKCRLNVIDALVPLFHGGPQVDPKYLWDYRGLIVGTDPVAIDAVCERILQSKRNEFQGRNWPIQPPTKHIALAEQKYGLGTADLNKIELVKIGWTEGALI